MERAHKVEPMVVHKDGAEGTIMVDALTGAITTPPHERPEWSEGLAAALLQERVSFYERRLGKQAEQFLTISQATALNFEDLGWIGVNDQQEEIEIEANAEYRSEAIAKLLDINTETGDIGKGVTHEIEVDTKRHTMSQHELSAMQQSIDTGFSDGTAEAQDQKTGTK